MIEGIEQEEVENELEESKFNFSILQIHDIIVQNNNNKKTPRPIVFAGTNRINEGFEPKFISQSDLVFIIMENWLLLHIPQCC